MADFQVEPVPIQVAPLDFFRIGPVRRLGFGCHQTMKRHGHDTKCSGNHKKIAPSKLLLSHTVSSNDQLSDPALAGFVSSDWLGNYCFSNLTLYSKYDNGKYLRTVLITSWEV